MARDKASRSCECGGSCDPVLLPLNKPGTDDFNDDIWNIGDPANFNYDSVAGHYVITDDTISLKNPISDTAYAIYVPRRITTTASGGTIILSSGNHELKHSVDQRTIEIDNFGTIKFEGDDGVSATPGVYRDALSHFFLKPDHIGLEASTLSRHEDVPQPFSTETADYGAARTLETGLNYSTTGGWSIDCQGGCFFSRTDPIVYYPQTYPCQPVFLHNRLPSNAQRYVNIEWVKAHVSETILGDFVISDFDYPNANRWYWTNVPGNHFLPSQPSDGIYLYQDVLKEINIETQRYVILYDNNFMQWVAGPTPLGFTGLVRMHSEPATALLNYPPLVLRMLGRIEDTDCTGVSVQTSSPVDVPVNDASAAFTVNTVFDRDLGTCPQGAGLTSEVAWNSI